MTDTHSGGSRVASGRPGRWLVWVYSSRAPERPTSVAPASDESSTSYSSTCIGVVDNERRALCQTPLRVSSACRKSLQCVLIHALIPNEVVRAEGRLSRGWRANQHHHLRDCLSDLQQRPDVHLIRRVQRPEIDVRSGGLVWSRWERILQKNGIWSIEGDPTVVRKE